MVHFLRSPLNWLLLFVPIAIGLKHFAPESHVLIFGATCAAIIPLAGLMGKATEHLAARAGEGIGGLLNATFGNAAELIIGLIALRDGMREIVKASLTGSIIGNILLVMGASILVGGLKHKVQRFNATAARVQSTMLTLAAIALILPAAYHHLAGPGAHAQELDLSLEISVVLLVTYAASLLFSLHTHRQFFAGEAAVQEEGHAPWSVGRSLVTLAVATAFVGWVSEILVGSVEQAAKSFGMTNIFIGVIVVAIIGNAAEHSTAILVAIKNRMDLSVTIAVGSSLQIALFVAPVLLIASYFVGPEPMDLVFTPAEVIAVALAIAITGQIAGDGESNWLEGVQLLAVYLVLGIVFYFLPEQAASSGAAPAAR